uniref:PALP domain-containing protein n=1 Tax=Heterorhabditis bacteriophora TaxID=37862 RepID=A0A1I7X7N7_HETBA
MLILYLLMIYRLADSASITPIKLHHLPLEKTLTQEEYEWRSNAIKKMWEERENMGHTPLIKFSNETATKTRTLKHRFVWALLQWAIVEGKVHSNSTVYDSTSGNTGASEAYMCTLVGLPYVAVVGDHFLGIQWFLLILTISLVRQITSNGGKIMKSTNVFHEILDQLEKDSSVHKKVPDYFVHSAGTGGTISSVGRYVARYNLPTKIVLSDSEFSLFYDYVEGKQLRYYYISDFLIRFTNESGSHLWVKPGVAGIGYGYNVKPIIFGETTRFTKTGRGLTLVFLYAQFLRVLYFFLQIIYFRKSTGDRLSVVTIICDPADFYESTYYNSTWLESSFAKQGGLNAIECWKNVIENSINNGSDFLDEGLVSCARDKLSYPLYLQ